MEYALIAKEDDVLVIKGFRHEAKEIDETKVRRIDGLSVLRLVVNDIRPEHDPATQRLVGPQYTIHAGFVTRFFTVEHLNADEVADRLLNQVRAIPDPIKRALLAVLNRVVMLEGGKALTMEAFEGYLATLIV